MSKNWTEREVRAGDAIPPDALNDELRVQRSSITTLDRDQLPSNYVDETRLEQYSLVRVWTSDRFPATSNEQGEQQAARDTSVPARAWISDTYQLDSGTWQDVSGSSITMSGFKGGNLYIEWAGAGYIYSAFSYSSVTDRPGNPKYLNLRIVVNGIVVAERRGPSYHEAFRCFGNQQLPPGDLTVQFQFRITQNTDLDPLTDAGGDNVMQAHLYRNQYVAVGRWR